MLPKLLQLSALLLFATPVVSKEIPIKELAEKDAQLRQSIVCGATVEALGAIESLGSDPSLLQFAVTSRFVADGAQRLLSYNAVDGSLPYAATDATQAVQSAVFDMADHLSQTAAGLLGADRIQMLIEMRVRRYQCVQAL